MGPAEAEALVEVPVPGELLLVEELPDVGFMAAF